MATSVTRRAVVSAAPAAFMAVAVPALAFAGTSAGPDAELLQLSKVFDRLHGEWQALNAAAGQIEPDTAATQTMDDFWRLRRETGYEDAVAVANTKLNELEVVAGRMRDLPAATLPGLVAKAHLARFDVNLSDPASMEGPEDEWDWNVLCIERFVREIERFASMSLKGGLNA